MKLLRSFAAKWVAKILYLVGVITDSRQKSNFFLSFHVLRLFCTVFFLAVAIAVVIFFVCLFFFGLYFALQGHMARSHLDKQGKRSQSSPFQPKS